jgi:hypothetical protein
MGARVGSILTFRRDALSVIDGPVLLGRAIASQSPRTLDVRLHLAASRQRGDPPSKLSTGVAVERRSFSNDRTFGETT